MTDKLSHRESTIKDANDLKIRAARWRDGNRISMEVYLELCALLDEGRCPQAVYVALVDMAFAKRGALAPKNPVATFRGIVTNQEQRIAHWVMANIEALIAPAPNWASVPPTWDDQ